MKKMLSVIVALSTLFSFAACSPVDAANLIWKVNPTLEYDDIQFFHAFGFIAYAGERMYVIDGKTGGIISETFPTGGFRVPFIYGFYSDTGTFFYNVEYSYDPEKTDVVAQASQNTAVAVYELERFVGDGISQPAGSHYYEYKDGSKFAIYYNGKFVSDFVYDLVVGGNSIAFVMQNDKYAFADGAGKLITEFIYDDVASIAKGYVAVKKGSAWGFVDASGKEMIAHIFAEAVNIDADTAFVKYNGKYGILDVKKTTAANYP